MLTHSRKNFLSATAGALAAASASPALAARPDDVAALYEAAKKEGAVTWWVSPYAIAVYQELVEAFKKKYPGIDLQMTRLTAQPIYQKVAQNLKAGIHECDVFNSSDAAHYVELKRQNALLSFVPPDIGEVPNTFKRLDADNTFQLGTFAMVALDYNPKRVVPGPKKWTDLIDPRMKGQISIGNPAFSGYLGIWALALQQKYGWEYFKALNALQPKVGRSILETVPDIVAGERTIGPSDAGLAYQFKAQGNAIDVAFPSDESILIVSPVAIMRDAPHPNAAKLLMNFYYSREYQAVLQRTANIPLRRDTPWVNGLRLQRIKYHEVPLEQQLTGIPEVVGKWREIFGV